MVITGCESIEVLDQAIDAAASFRPLSDDAVAALLDKTAPAAQRGEWEPFKTSSIFDSTAVHPEWLGEESERVQALSPG